MKFPYPLLASALLVTACAQTPTDQTSLADLYADSFKIGVALNPAEIRGEDPAAARLIERHFNSYTAEDDMKWELIEPTEGNFDWSVADDFVALSERNDAFMVGHTLLWHSQTPDWVFEDSDGNPASREIVLARLKRHIEAVVGRYKGRVQSWDVVNEAFEDDGTWRDTPWRRTIGPDFIARAFEFAHAADPEAELYYNDYNLFKAPKRNAVIKLVKALRAEGLPVHGVGIQGHYGIGYPPMDELEASIVALGKLDVKILVTELDISVLPFPSSAQQGADISLNFELRAELNPYVDGLPQDVSAALADAYRSLFELYLKHADVIDRVTLWNLTDASTWRNNWPMPGRTDHPVLFDRQNEPKDAFHALVNLKIFHDR
ncbi:MAG: endo-1,4-beta-xylanase [Opitutaceae bacterium]|jgi:endo-1,4-beta-xylanase|nr:endo-1,4-beta-xylanase [Opitutaceae bacterium]